MSNLTTFNSSQISKIFQSQSSQNDLSSGIASSFGIVGYRGKVWSIKYRGEEKQLLRPNNEGPVNSIECIVVGASRNVSKIYYASGYTEGANAAPDCFSNNGVTPEASAKNIQSPTCAACPRNVWGAVISPVTGKAKKECQDNKRLAIVPLDDIANEVYGGPMLLRVPAASLQELAHFGNKMNRMGYPYYSFGTRISFAISESYPKFEFTAIRPLSDEEAAQVVAMRDSDTVVRRILSENIEFVAEAQETPSGVFERTQHFEKDTTWTKPTSISQQVSSAPPVEPNTKPTILQAARVTASPSSPMATMPESAGTATTANTAPTPPSGLTASPEASPKPNGEAFSNFEQELDAMVAKLLPD